MRLVTAFDFTTGIMRLTTAPNHNAAGTLTINAGDLYIKETESKAIIIQKFETVKYDWSPWCIVHTDHKTFMTIETIENNENTYKSGSYRQQYDQGLFNHWKHIFGRLEPVTLPTLSTMSQQ